MYLKKIEVEAIGRCSADKSKVKFRMKPSTNIGELLPYLNNIYSNSIYYEKKPSLELSKDEAVILLDPERIILKELRNTSKGFKLRNWIKEEINKVYEDKDEIEPDYTSKEKLSAPEVYKNLPQLNCGDCGERTCFAFATLYLKGKYELKDCKPLFKEEYRKERNELENYI